MSIAMSEEAWIRRVADLNDRIRELEEKDEIHWKTRKSLVEERDNLARKIVEFALLEDRIAKAREILKASSGMEGYVEDDIQGAINALEGK